MPLQAMTLQNAGNVSQQLNDFTVLAEKLVHFEITIQGELLVIMLLSSLPKEHDNFVIAMETRDTLPKPASVKQKILEEWTRRRRKMTARKF